MSHPTREPDKKHPANVQHAHVAGTGLTNWWDMMHGLQAAGFAAMDQGLNLQQAWLNAWAQSNTQAAQAATAWLQQYSIQNPPVPATNLSFFRTNRNWFGPFSQQVGAEFEQWITNRAYSHIKSSIQLNHKTIQTLSKQLNWLPEPTRSWARLMLMTNQEFQRKLMNSDGAAQSLRNISGTLNLPDNRLYHADRNHQFLSETAQGGIHAIDEDAIIELFPSSDEVNSAKDAFPRILITSSHADTRSENSITDITHGIRALVRDTLPQADGHNRDPFTYVKPGGSIDPDSSKVLTLFACDTECSNLDNAAALTERLNEMERLGEDSAQDRFNHISPGAKRISRLILRTMLQDPSELPSYQQDSRSIAEIMADRNSQILLRAKPELIAQHFLLMGYSKGGNVVSDAMRYLVHELEAINAQQKDVFQVQMDHGHPYEITYHGLTSIRNIIRNIGCISMAALETDMDPYYLDRGVRRVSFNNRHDPISTHREFTGSKHDERWLVEGETARMGHEPKDAMGTIKGNRQGYFITDERVKRRLSEAFAPYFGKAAIYDVQPGYDEQEKPCLIIETAPGTTDEMFSKAQNTNAQSPQEKLQRAFEKHFTSGAVRMEMEGGNTGIFRVYFDQARYPLYEENGILNRATQEKVLAALETLRDPRTVGLVMAQDIIDQLKAHGIGSAPKSQRKSA